MNWKHFDEIFKSMDKLFKSIDWDNGIKTYKRTEVKTRPRRVYDKPPRKKWYKQTWRELFGHNSRKD